VAAMAGVLKNTCWRGREEVLDIDPGMEEMKWMDGVHVPPL
jgi:hypothetical protein